LFKKSSSDEDSKRKERMRFCSLVTETILSRGVSMVLSLVASEVHLVIELKPVLLNINTDVSTVLSKSRTKVEGPVCY
jgi:hypothetical protein